MEPTDPTLQGALTQLITIGATALVSAITGMIWRAREKKRLRREGKLFDKDKRY
jgi:hypothetical protein